MQDLTTGQTVPLPAGAITVRLAVAPGEWRSSGLALVGFLLDGQRKAPGNDAVVGEMLERAANGAVTYDDARTALVIEPERLPPTIERIAVCAVVRDGAGRGLAFNAFDRLEATVESGLRYALPCRDRGEAAMIVVEVYRRNAEWKLRAVGQGFVWGLRKLAESFGLDLPDRIPGTEDPPRRGPAPAEGGSSGTGFAVQRDGYLLTNAHVVEPGHRLAAVSSRGRHEAHLVFADPVNDLALVKVAAELPQAAAFRDGRSAGMGETVMAAGFPLAGLLGSAPSVSLGNISSLVAVRDDTRMLRFTAPIQAGNSGGPLLDASGLVVGVVVAKLAAQRVHELTGDLPEGMNFAIKGALARLFLEAAGIEPELRPPGPPRPSDEVAREACGFTWRIVCER